MIRKPMKGQAIEVEDFDKLTYPKYASPKLDGFRCVLGEHPFTSRMSQFPNHHFHRTMSNVLSPLYTLDGEVVVGDRRGKGVLNRTSSGLTSEAGEPDFTLWVFDSPSFTDAKWIDRYEKVKEIIFMLGHSRIKLLKHVLIENASQAKQYLQRCLDLEYEGMMIRGIDNLYKEGKSTLREQGLLKVKPFVDFEATITGYYEEQENVNPEKRDNTGKLKRSSSQSGKRAKGTLGGFIIEDLKTSIEGRVGGGFTKDQRESYWEHREELVGKIIRCKKQLMGQKDKPRHPNFLSFVDFRPLWDF